MARDASMAVIEDALVPKPSVEPDDSVVSDIVPGVETPSRETLAGEEERDVESEDAKSERQKLIDDAIAKRQEEKDAFEENANATVNAIQRIARNTGVTIEKLPTPGSVMLPLLALGILMFLLIPVNGHTRLVWLWLVVTQNASTGGAAQAPIFSELAITAAPPIMSPGQSAGLSFAGNEHPS